MDIELLVKVTERAWCLPIVALMHDGTPGRQAPLLAKSGAGRTAFAQSLAHLIEIGLVERNPGHGHPLRPEFRLTPRGVAFGPTAARIMACGAADESGLIRRAWTVPVLTVIHQPRQFSQIRRSLGRITDRALSQSLRRMEDQRWLTRHVDPSAYPPRPLYQAANLGRDIAEAAQPG